MIQLRPPIQVVPCCVTDRRTQGKGDIRWTSEQISIIMDAFHYGDLVGRLPGGLLSQRYGGKRIVGFTLLLASLSTALIPLTARFHFSVVVLLRFVAGSSAVRECMLLVSKCITIPVFGSKNQFDMRTLKSQK